MPDPLHLGTNGLFARIRLDGARIDSLLDCDLILIVVTRRADAIASRRGDREYLGSKRSTWVGRITWIGCDTATTEVGRETDSAQEKEKRRERPSPARHRKEEHCKGRPRREIPVPLQSRMSRRPRSRPSNRRGRRNRHGCRAATDERHRAEGTRGLGTGGRRAPKGHSAVESRDCAKQHHYLAILTAVDGQRLRHHRQVVVGKREREGGGVRAAEGAVAVVRCVDTVRSSGKVGRRHDRDRRIGTIGRQRANPQRDDATVMCVVKGDGTGRTNRVHSCGKNGRCQHDIHASQRA